MDKQNNAKLNGTASEEVEIDLLDLCSVYLSQLPLLIITFIIGAMIAGLITFFMITPKYTASSKLYMVSASSGSAIDLTDLNIGTSLSEDYEVLMQIRPIYEEVIEDLDLDYTYDQLLDMVSIGSINDTRVVKVTVTSTDPEEARDIANAIADKAVTYLPQLMETSAPNIAERAILPERKSSPSLTKNTIIGALVGLILCLAVLTIMYLLDDTLKTGDDVEKEFGIIPLTVIPEGDVQSISDKAEEEIEKAKKKQRKQQKKQKKDNKQKGGKAN
jgi:capsular polysaccharide biosynthesis protein